MKLIVSGHKRCPLTPSPALRGVTHYENDDRVRLTWKFLRPAEFDGYHHAEADTVGNGNILCRSVVEMNARGLKGTLLWLLVMRALHDAVVEDGLDKIERDFGFSSKDREWSPWVRLLRWLAGRKSVEYQRLRREKLERQADLERSARCGSDRSRSGRSLIRFEAARASIKLRRPLSSPSGTPNGVGTPRRLTDSQSLDKQGAAIW